MTEQMWVIGYRGGRRAEALALVPYIEAAVMRASNDPLVLGGMYRYQAILLNAEGKFAEALAAVQRALALLAVSDRVNGPTSQRSGMALTNIGMVLDAQEQWDEAHAINLRRWRSSRRTSARITPIWSSRCPTSGTR